MGTELMAVTAITESGSRRPGLLPVVAITCTNCGRVDFYNAVVLGLVEDE
jgi:hypothetical protein